MDDGLPPTFEARLNVLERHRLLAWGSAAGMIVGVCLFAAFVGLRFAPGAMGLHLAMLGAFLRGAQATKNVGARRAAREVRVSRAGVLVDGRPIARHAIAGGWFQPRSGHSSTVCLRDRYRRILLEAEVSEAQALEVLRLLGLDAGSRRAEFAAAAPAAATFGRYIGFVVAIAVAILGIHTLAHRLGLGHPQPWMLVAIVSIFMLAILPSKIVVGVDGILVRWLWWRRFIPMSEVVAVLPEGDRVIRIQLVSGKEEKLYTGNRRTSLLSQRPHRDAVLARILEAWNTHRQRGPTADVAALVARGARTAREWRRALEQLDAADRGYRAAAVRDEDLWRVVEDPRVTEDARAGAAVLLRKRLGADGRTRVRVAAEATASPRLRVALEATASGGDEALDAALGELAGDADPARARAAG